MGKIILFLLFICPLVWPEMSPAQMSDDSKGFISFKKNFYPIIMAENSCVRCHSEKNPDFNPAFAVSDAKKSYDYIKHNHFFDPKNVSDSILLKGAQPNMAGKFGMTKETLIGALQKWWDEGEREMPLESQAQSTTQKSETVQTTMLDNTANLPDLETIDVFNKAVVKKASHFVSINASANEPIEFDMGSSSGVGYNENLHRVKLTNSFEFQSTDVTQLQWYLVMKDQTQVSANPFYFQSENYCDSGSYPKPSEHLPSMCKHHPVENVSYDDIQLFLKRLNSLSTTYNYRLPTEAEWEYMAHAGLPSEYAYGWGNDFDGNYAWYDGNSGRRTHEVATKEGIPSPQNMNELIYDMAGNVWQWVQDWYGDYPSGTQTDPPGPSSGSDRVLRGGSWDFDPQFLRSARRGSYSPGFRYYGSIGFRLVRTPRNP